MTWEIEGKLKNLNFMENYVTNNGDLYEDFFMNIGFPIFDAAFSKKLTNPYLLVSASIRSCNEDFYSKYLKYYHLLGR